MKFVRNTYVRVPIMLVMLAALGCNAAKTAAKKAIAAGEQAAKDAEKALTTAADDSMANIEEATQNAGKITVTLDQPYETKACYARFVPQAPGRQTVFELRSYRTPEREEAPAVFFHAQTGATNVAELAAEGVSGRLFVLPVENGPTWFSAAGTKVELKITSVTDGVLKAEIVGVPLRNTQTGETTKASLTISAVPQ